MVIGLSRYTGAGVITAGTAAGCRVRATAQAANPATPAQTGTVLATGRCRTTRWRRATPDRNHLTAVGHQKFADLVWKTFFAATGPSRG
jgi:hypothetical protein